jgi:hypothetical protein
MSRIRSVRATAINVPGCYRGDAGAPGATETRVR